MEWDVFRCWLEALKRRNDGPEQDPGSWAGTAEDPWWQEARALRDAQRGR